MTFGAPAWFALLVVPGLVVVYRVARGNAAIPFPAANVARSIPASARRRCAWLPLAVRAAVLALLAAGLAQPRFESGASLDTRAPGIDIQLLLDASTSMEDAIQGGGGPAAPARSRIEVARDVLDRFVAARPHDRIGLVTFARHPHPVCPLTLDHAALRELLAGVRTVADDRADGTAIGVALAAALLYLAPHEPPAADAEPRTRVVVLLTDGSNNVADVEPLEAAALARDLGVRVYTVAFGRRDRAGELAAAAEKTGGRGFTAGDAQMLERVYATIDELEKHALAEPRPAAYRDAQAPCFGIAALLVLCEVLAGAFWLRRAP